MKTKTIEVKVSEPVTWSGIYTDKRGIDHPLDLKVQVEKRDEDLLIRSANKTSHRKIKKMSAKNFYAAEHSPIRTTMFWVEIDRLPNFAHTHFVRHTIWNQPFVKTGREDRGMKGEQTRWTPTEMGLWMNAQTLINMSRKRLCGQSHFVSRKIMQMVKDAVADVDPDLADFMNPECVYRGGQCNEYKPCKPE